MSRVGKKPVVVPAGVEVSFDAGVLRVKGKQGELTRVLSPLLVYDFKDGVISVSPIIKDAASLRVWGLYVVLIRNAVVGVETGFTKTLEMVGVGYRAVLDAGGKMLTLSLGYSHPVKIVVPSRVKVVCPKPTTMEISSYDVEFLGVFASEIRKLRPPEPYKGKGVMYSNEVIYRKQGKKK